MPPIRSLQAPKPLKTERTHEENQERAYIAASRRSDRSLEARIESARRASEIHKKRTGRALRVTEQDVINEEMYEEEDDLPAQYQRLTAHLQSNSLVFNRKLHDYIATQTAVRNSFMQQYQNPYAFQQQFASNGPPQGMQPFPGQQMLPPAVFSQPSQPFNQSQQQQFSPQPFQHSQQDYRQSPYPMPNRPQSHQRSASIPTPQHMSDYHQSPPQPSPVAGTPQNFELRRMSLPPGALDTVPHHMADPQSQVLSINPLSMSLPPESQQFVGSALDPNDPNTAILMAGSESINQPFRKGYHYNPNVSPKTSQAWSISNSETTYPNVTCSSGMNSTLAPGDTIKVDTPTNTSYSGPHSAVSEDLGSPSAMFGHPSFEIGNYGDMYQNTDYPLPGSQGSQEDFDGNAFFNFCNE